MYICPGCGARIYGDAARYCISCGEKLDASAWYEVDPEQSGNSYRSEGSSSRTPDDNDAQIPQAESRIDDAKVRKHTDVFGGGDNDSDASIGDESDDAEDDDDADDTDQDDDSNAGSSGKTLLADELSLDVSSGTTPDASSTSFQALDAYADTYLDYDGPSENGINIIYSMYGGSEAFDVIQDYVELLTDCMNFELVDSYEQNTKSTYFAYALEYTGTATVNVKNSMNFADDVYGDVTFWGSIEDDDLEVHMTVPNVLSAEDLGWRYGGTADISPKGDSVTAGLYQLSDGSYETTDGRLTTTLGSAAVNDPNACNQALQEAMNDGTRVIYIDSAATLEGEATFATDNYAAGQMAAEELLSVMSEAGVTEGQIGLISAQAGVQSCVDRVDGFCSIIEDTDFTVSEVQYSEGDTSTAQEMATNLINNGAVALFGANEAATIGCGNAATEAVNKIYAVGFDNSSANRALIEKDAIQAYMAQNPYDMGYQGMMAAADILDGADYDGLVTDTGVTVVTSENVEEFAEDDD